jgi:hypothetical protein
MKLRAVKDEAMDAEPQSPGEDVPNEEEPSEQALDAEVKDPLLFPWEWDERVWRELFNGLTDDPKNMVRLDLDGSNFE